MAEVRIIRNGTFSIEPTGPDPSALPDSVPPPDPPIPFENFRSFLTSFANGSINPCLVFQKTIRGTGALAFVPSEDGSTDLVFSLPAALDIAQTLIGGETFIDLQKDSIAVRALMKATGPAPEPGQDLQLLFALTSTADTGEILAVFHTQPTGFSFIAQIGTSSGSVALCPYVQGSEYNFRFQYRPLKGGGCCLSVTAVQDGIIVATSTFSLPERSDFPFFPIVNGAAFTQTPASFAVTLREFGLGYQPLAGEIPTCP